MLAAVAGCGCGCTFIQTEVRKTTTYPLRPLHPTNQTPPIPPPSFLNGTEAERVSMLKLIPHIPNASWVIKQSVGTVPVILGNKLKTTFYRTDR
jgi:hypothetical protein